MCPTYTLHTSHGYGDRVSVADLPTSLVTSWRPTFRIDIGCLSATPLTDLLRKFSLRQVSHSSFSVGIVTSYASAVYTLNTDPKINVINSDGSFLTTTCKLDDNFKKRGKVWSNRIKSKQKKYIQNSSVEETLDKMGARLEATLKKKTVGSICAAKGRVCIVSTNFSKSTALTATQNSCGSLTPRHTSWTKREFCELVFPCDTR